MQTETIKSNKDLWNIEIFEYFLRNPIKDIKRHYRTLFLHNGINKCSRHLTLATCLRTSK